MHNFDMTNQQPIGIFDSGVGGLSIAKCITQRLPNEQLIYIADSAYAPYGVLSINAIEHRVNTIASALIDKGCKALVVACNTATVNAIEQLRATTEIPIIGVEPAIKPAALQSINKTVGILVTQATATNERFLHLVDQHKNGANVIIQPCPGLVEIIENGDQSSAKCHDLLKNYLTPLIDQHIDTLVLGCTHYPFVKKAIKQIVGEHVIIMETALPVTEQLARQLTKYKLIANLPTTKAHEFFSSNANYKQNNIINHLWQSKVNLKLLQ